MFWAFERPRYHRWCSDTEYQRWGAKPVSAKPVIANQQASKSRQHKPEPSPDLAKFDECAKLLHGGNAKLECLKYLPSAVVELPFCSA